MKGLDATVVIPTYQRAELLRHTLESLARQRTGTGTFEVVVADDGSSDGTRDVVESFGDRLELQYFFQEDKGFRLSKVRNEAARLSRSPLLIFLDTGTLAGPDFVAAHLEAQRETGRAGGVIGYTYAYQPVWGTPPEFKGLLEILSPEQIVDRYGTKPWMRDWRHGEYERRALEDRVAPWVMFMAMNCSIPAARYRDIGGFHERFQKWGVEDLEFAFRLHQSGATFSVSRAAWAIEYPHERAMLDNLQGARENADIFHDIHPHPVVELARQVLRDSGLWEIEDATRSLLEWSEEAAAMDVGHELDAIRMEPGERVAVLGCGDRVPEALRHCVLVDFDRRKLEKALDGQTSTAYHALGLRLPVPDKSVDRVFVTSRLSGVWEQWGDAILTEARRIGHAVYGVPERAAVRS